jgi:hypothetical protein
MKESDLPRHVICYDDFDLPFVREIDANEEGTAGESSVTDHPDALRDKIPSEYKAQLKAMRDKVPAECIFLGSINFEIPHSPGLTWDIDDYYYLMRWSESDYDWALFRITWEDNWGRYEWNAAARIKGEKDHKEAARLMFIGLMDNWGFDLDDKDFEEDYAPYREFLDRL